MLIKIYWLGQNSKKCITRSHNDSGVIKNKFYVSFSSNYSHRENSKHRYRKILCAFKF